MVKAKYRFNPESLKYERVEHTTRHKIIKTFKYSAAVLFTSTVLYIGWGYFFETPKEQMLRRENSFLLNQYEFLNRKLDQVLNIMADVKDRDDNIYRVIFEAEPIPSTVRKAGMGGINRYEKLEGYKNSELVIETARQLDDILKQLYVQSKSYDEVIDLAKNKTLFFASIPAIQPIASRDQVRFASGFGFRIHPIYKTLKMHEGVDITAPTGTVVRATGNGTVVHSGISDGGFGKLVIIDHGYGYKTFYAHLNKCSLRKGSLVKRGEIVGMVGNTGRSTAPHLHYEVRKNDKPVNPINYYFNDLTPEEYDEMILVSSQMNQTFD